ncbi:MAG: TetR family transcriptional regulator [Deltaproteobacteria bacterium]|nr:TetR family transcriptional regulator [Deltaproteobacteria bacterium]
MAGASRPKARGQRTPPRRDREALLDALEAHFLGAGLRATTVETLASALRCSRRTLYEIAPSKERIFLLVVRRWLERVRQLGWQGALTHEAPQERIAAFLEPGVSESRKASSAFVADVQAFAPARALLEAHQRERVRFLRELVEEGIARGSFRPLHSHLVAEMLLVTITRINDPAFLAEARLRFSEAFAELYELLLHGLFLPERRPGRSDRGKR